MGGMTKRELVEKLGIEKDIDFAIPQGFQDCLLIGSQETDDQGRIEYCGYDPDPQDFVWDYRPLQHWSTLSGTPLHLGEEILHQLGEGELFLLTREEMEVFENLKRDKRRRGR